MEPKNEYKIVKILNFPDISIEVNQKFTIDTEKRSYKFDSLCSELEKIPLQEEPYNIESLYCEDESGEKITLFNVSIIIYGRHIDDRFVISQNGIIIGAHISSLEALNVTKLKCSIEDINQVRRLSIYNEKQLALDNGINIKLSANFEDYIWGMKEPVSFYYIGCNENTVKLSEMQESFYYWRELIFLIHGFFPTFSWYSLEWLGKNVLYRDYNKEYLEKNIFSNRKQEFNKNIDLDKVIKKWPEIRKKYGKTIDFFFSTIHNKDIFWEFHPFMMVACIDGLSSKNSSDDETRPEVKSGDAKIRHEVRNIINSDEAKLILGNISREKKDNIVNKLCEHRHWFAHAKFESEHQLERKEGIDIAINLREILRLVMLNECIKE